MVWDGGVAVVGRTFELMFDRELYHNVMVGGILQARELVLIATANLKEFAVELGGRAVRFSEAVASLAGRGVSFYFLCHDGALKSMVYSRLQGLGNVHFGMCGRQHMKLVIVDDRLAYVGSANMTGAGVGMRGEMRRNFEVGMMTEDPQVISQLRGAFERVWSGEQCSQCYYRRKGKCSGLSH